MVRSQTRLDVDGAIATLTLARPGVKNAMTEAMGEEVRQTVLELNGRGDVRVVIVRGDGGVFSGGGDFSLIEARAAAEPESNRVAMEKLYRLFLSIRDLRVPSIAVIEGAAFGAGACFAIACDVRLADRDAKLAFNFVRIGLHPGMGASHLLPRLVGPARAAELLFSGRTVNADEAKAIGLVNDVLDARSLDAAVAGLAGEIAAASPLAVEQTKRSLRAGERTLDEALRSEAEAQAVDFAGEDVAEGIRAFRERRPPAFRHR